LKVKRGTERGPSRKERSPDRSNLQPFEGQRKEEREEVKKYGTPQRVRYEKDKGRNGREV